MSAELARAIKPRLKIESQGGSDRERTRTGPKRRETKGESYPKSVCLGRKRERSNSGSWKDFRLEIEACAGPLDGPGLPLLSLSDLGHTYHLLLRALVHHHGMLTDVFFPLYLITVFSMSGTVHCRFRAEDYRQVSCFDRDYLQSGGLNIEFGEAMNINCLLEAQPAVTKSLGTIIRTNEP